MTSKEKDTGNTEDDENSWENVIIRSVGEVSSTMEDLLKYARSCIQESVTDFIQGKIKKLFSLTAVYRDCFKRLNVTNRKELGRLLEHHFRHRKIQDIVQEFEELEDEWDTLLKDIDKENQKDSEKSVEVNEEGPVLKPLTDARTGEEDTITSAKGLVIVVSFGERKGAEKWIEDTGCTFPVLLDAERKVYQKFGLHRSVYKVWNIPSIVYYAEQLTIGRTLPKPYENVHDDPNQMGGDFIMDKTGHMKFMYCSKSSVDRPSVDTLVQELKNLN